MLKSVVDKDVSSLSIGIFLFTLNIDTSFALAVAGFVKSKYNLSSHYPELYGKWVGLLCIIPVALAIPIVYFAGKAVKTRNEDQIKKGFTT